ncbi:MAG: ABC transporter permease [Thermoanaerobaculia bacterium]|jgi:peptide/nickel transport system permease protein|nr:ABC transporter permease [Thermoanaerobaculia bacterium]MBP9822696.1 ABC transporter permease [Thermoanaerobaculia bacterium]
MPEIAPRAERSDSRTFRAGWVLLAFIVGTVALLPELWPRSPDRQLDPAAAGLARPGSRFDIVPLADGRTLAAVAIEVTSSEVVLHGQPRPTRVALGDLAGAMDSQTFPLGSDEFGRDVAARVLAGGRVSLAVAGWTVLLICLVAVPLGALSGSAPPAVDRVVLRTLEALQAFPRLFLLLGLAAIVRPGVLSIVLILGLTGWIPMARLVRAEVRALRDREFVLAARATGAGRARVVLRHLLPNALAPALVEASLAAASAIVNEAALSFLGFGLQPPSASWGNMIADGRSTLSAGWWVAFFPGAALALTAIAFNLVGEGLRDKLDPRARVRASLQGRPPAAQDPSPQVSSQVS